MGIGGSLRALGRFIDACERQPKVERVALRDDWDQDSTGVLTVDVHLSLATGPSDDGRQPLSLADGSVDDDGTLSLQFETIEDVLPTVEEEIDLEPVDAAFGDDGTASVTLAVSMTPGDDADDSIASAETDGANSASDRSESDLVDAGADPVDAGTGLIDDAGNRTTAESTADEADDSDDPDAPSRDREIPPFKDYELLCEVYESCETFAEMPAALGMDVTAETVRRYMIDYGIHEPNTYDTSGGDDREAKPADAEPEPPIVLADGVGLPEDVTVDRLVETVDGASTLYEVQTDLGIDREDALELLERLDLVGHVVGRLSTADERAVSRDLIVERLRKHTEPRSARASD